MRELSKKTIYLITIGCFLSFFLFGFIDNLKGPTLPSLLKELNYNYSTGGTILFGAYVGFFAATLFSGILSHFTGKKAILFIAGFALLAGISIYQSSRSFIMFILLHCRSRCHGNNKENYSILPE